MSDIHSFEPLWGTWHVVRQIGKGSTGTVWLVQRKDSLSGQDQYAAVKHLSIPSGSVEMDGLTQQQVRAFYERQQREIKAEIDALAALKGKPRIMAYEDHRVIPKKDQPGYDIFLRTELLCPLRDYIKQCQGLNLRQVLELGLHIAEAIEALQNRSLIHRDIRPANIFVDYDGEFKLGDFATARMVEQGKMAMTRTGAIQFMAPEMYVGKPYDHTVDIYSLGMMLYTYLNDNRVPLQGDGMTPDQAMKLRIANRQPIPAPKHAPEDLAPIILKAIAFNPADRYTSASQLIRDLRRIIARHRNELNNLTMGPTPVMPTTPTPIQGVDGNNDGRKSSKEKKQKKPKQPKVKGKKERQPSEKDMASTPGSRNRFLLAAVVLLIMIVLVLCVVILGTAVH